MGGDLEAELGGLDGVGEAGVEGGVAELGQVVSDCVHQQVVQVALAWRPSIDECYAMKTKINQLKIFDIRKFKTCRHMASRI